LIYPWKRQKKEKYKNLDEETGQFELSIHKKQRENQKENNITAS